MSESHPRGVFHCRIQIRHMEPQPDAELNPYLAVFCTCGYQEAFNQPIEALDGAYQHYTSVHDAKATKMFIDYGPDYD